MSLDSLRNLGFAALLAVTATVHAETTRPDWQPWSPQAFAQAKRDGRLVLLDVKAEWCVACRRMDETGFRDPRVLDMLRRHYIPVRADIDREPEIMKRYGARGVPAVVILDAAGNEIMQRRGYLKPDWLYWMLVAVADNPDPKAHQ